MKTTRGWILMENTICQGDISCDWIEEGGHESLDLGTCADKGREALDLRIAFLQSRLDAIEDEDDTDDIIGNATDDQDVWLQEVEIEGAGPGARVYLIQDDGERDLVGTLQEFSKRSGRNLPVRWPPMLPVDSPHSGEQNGPVSSTTEGNS